MGCVSPSCSITVGDTEDQDSFINGHIDTEEQEKSDVPDFGAGADMLVEAQQTDVEKKRSAQPEMCQFFSNKKKLVSTFQHAAQGNKLAAQRMIDTGAAIAAHGAAVLQTMTTTRTSRTRKQEFGQSRIRSPSRSRSRRNCLSDCEDQIDI